MREYVILTDSGADLGSMMLNKLDVKVIPLKYRFGEEVYDGRPGGENGFTEFYDRLRNGEVSSTSQNNAEDYLVAFEPYIKDGKDIIYISLSSGLSGTHNSARLAGEELEEKYPEAKVFAIDSLAASMGQGLLVWHAAQLRSKGKTVAETAQWVEENKMNLAMWVTVDDLNFLKRGGRVSAASALFGTMLNIKPIIHVDNEGKLIPVDKVRGRKPSINYLLEEMAKTAINPKDQMVFISHGDCIDDIKYLEQEIRKRFGTTNFYLDYIGPVIGSHSGPGTVALFFLADKR